MVNAKKDGIYFSRRVIFFMIFASLIVNVFFLLMGILIGKDDLKWSRKEAVQDGEVPLAGPIEPVTANPIDDELSVFGDERNAKRREPIDPSYLDEGGSKVTSPGDLPPKSSPKSAAEVPPSKSETGSTRRPTTTLKPPEPRPGIDAPASVYWIQVRAIRDGVKARAFLAKVRTRGFSGVIVQEADYHKVRIGPYSARSSADRDRSRLAKELGADAWIVKKP